MVYLLMNIISYFFILLKIFEDNRFIIPHLNFYPPKSKNIINIYTIDLFVLYIFD
nr:MAG TPA: hypothetical protein [Bacteriophage sp.]